MNYPEISVIIPTFNNGPELERAVLSVLNQDAFTGEKDRVEIIIINDNSDNDYIINLRHLANKYSCITLLHNKKQMGPAAARNYGISQAKGNLIGFLDADDEWHLNKISTLLPFFNDANIDVAGGKVKYIIKEGLDHPVFRYEDEQQSLTHVHLGALLLRKNIFERGFYFDESLIYSEDMDWWLRLRENKTGIVISEKTTLLYHVHGNNMTVKKNGQDLYLLQVLHKSLQRRKTPGYAQNIPQVKDFRTQRADPLISIILPLHNGKAVIEKTLKSVLAQTYTNWELCVIDDGSIDEGAEFILAIYPTAKIIKTASTGIPAALNEGVNTCNGDIIAFLDKGDEWLPAKLSEQWALLKHDPYLSFVTCNQVAKCDEDAALTSFFNKELEKEHRSFMPGAILIRKHALLTVGGFDEHPADGSGTDIVGRLRNAGFKDGNASSVLLQKWHYCDDENLNLPENMREINSAGKTSK